MATGQVMSHLRLGLNPRQTETVDKLLRAGEEELREVGPEALTIRMVAQRAGVSPATAYTYLASKNHLFAELFRRRIVTDDAPEPVGATAAERIRVVTRHIVALLARSPHLASAANYTLLGSDPEVERLRREIGTEFVTRFRDAIGEPFDPRLVDTITLAFTGALLQAGMGLVTYDELSGRLDDVVTVIMEGHER